MLPNPLSAVADVLAILATESPDDALLVRIEGGPPTHPDDEIDLGVRPLESHPVDALLGFEAPAGWWALGVVTAGWANAAEDVDGIDFANGTRRGPRLADRPGRRRATTVTLIARDGTEASRIAIGDEPPMAPGPAAGLVPDCLRRALGVATEPPAVGTGHLFAAMWLHSITDTSATARRRVGWTEAAALHPVGSGSACDELVEVAAGLASVVDWPALRKATVEGRWCVPDLEPTVAAWMDEGMFARWVMGGVLPIPELLRRVAEATSTGTFGRVRAALSAMLGTLPEAAQRE
jgi:hypothetical protein